MPVPAPLADFPLTLSETPGGVRGRAPTLGEHTEVVLGEIGIGLDEIAALRAAKLV